jgi:hypothetical protein
MEKYSEAGYPKTNKIMKKRAIFFFNFLIAINIAHSQIEINDLKELNNKAEYAPGQDVFREIVAMHLRYPLDFASNPKICTMLGVLKISKSGEIVDCGSINKVAEAFVRQLINVSKQLKGGWVFPDDSASYYYVIIPMTFRFSSSSYLPDLSNQPDYFIPGIVCVMFGDSRIKDNDYYLARINKAFSRNKHKKAVKTIELLLEREPLNIDYINLMITATGEINDSNGHNYYKEYLRIITASQGACRVPKGL